MGSWSDVAVADFIEALLEMRKEDESNESETAMNGRSTEIPKIVSRL